jgi:hypothetical protein
MFANSCSSASSSAGAPPGLTFGSVFVPLGKGTELDGPAFWKREVSPHSVGLMVRDDGARRSGGGLG